MRLAINQAAQYERRNMVEVIKKHFMSKKVSKRNKETRIENLGENLANGYLMGMLSGIYSVENL